MSATLMDRVDNLDKKIERLGNMLSDSGREMVEVHRNGRAAAVSFFENEPDTGAQFKGMTPITRRRSNQLPEGYRGQFKSMSDFLRLGMRKSESFAENYQKSLDSLVKAYGLNSYEGESGGNLVLPEFAPLIREREYDNDLWTRTDQYTVAGNSMTFPKMAEASRAHGQRHGGVRAYWEGEEHAIATAKPKIEETSLRLSKLAVAVFVTNELLEDESYALQQWVTRVVRREFAFMKGFAITSGTGVKQPLGYVGAPGTVVVAKESGQAANTIVGKNILNMWARRDASLPVTDFVWTINQDCEPQLNQLTLTGTSGNELVYTPPGGLSSTPYATLMGRPVIPTEFNETLGTVGDIALCAFSQMLSISKGGLNEDTSTHVEFLRDLTCYKFTERLDARPLESKPLTPFKGTATQSAFVTLATRA